MQVERLEDWSMRIPPAPGQIEFSMPGIEQMSERLKVLTETQTSCYKAMEGELLDRRKNADLLLLRAEQAEARCSNAERQLGQYRQNEQLLRASQEEKRLLVMHVEEAKNENKRLKEVMESKDAEIVLLKEELKKAARRDEAMMALSPKAAARQGDKRTAVIKKNMVTGEKLTSEKEGTTAPLRKLALLRDNGSPKKAGGRKSANSRPSTAPNQEDARFPTV